MSRPHARVTISLVWFSAIALGLAVATAFGWSASPLRVATAFAFGCLPLLVVAVVFRGRPPQTIGEVIYDAQQDLNPKRAGLGRIEKEDGR